MLERTLVDIQNINHLFWNNYAEAFSNRSLNPRSYYLSEYINYGRLEQQSNLKWMQKSKDCKIKLWFME